jgi:hypothetical protein
MTETAASAPPASSEARRGVRAAYHYLAGLFVLGVVAQVFLAGVGAFGAHARKVENASSFDPHRATGEILGLVALILLILSLIYWSSKRLIGETFLLVVLVEVAQHALAAGGDSNKWVGGLHALDGIIILLLGVVLHLETRDARTAATP